MSGKKVEISVLITSGRPHSSAEGTHLPVQFNIPELLLIYLGLFGWPIIPHNFHLVSRNLRLDVETKAENMVDDLY